jgi:hypothetical protein
MNITNSRTQHMVLLGLLAHARTFDEAMQRQLDKIRDAIQRGDECALDLEIRTLDRLRSVRSEVLDTIVELGLHPDWRSFDEIPF